MRVYRVASRRSALAMQQTQWVIARLTEQCPSAQFEVVPVVTKGDQILDVALSKVGGKGLFVSEIEARLLTGEADLAVHSLKDVPAELATGLHLSGIPDREDPRDAWISRSGQGFFEIPAGSRVGTSSLRRAAQLRGHRPDLVYEPVRGNIDTRLRKLENGEFDAIVLAAAGLRRMGWANRVTGLLSPEVCLPAVGQGILGIETRVDDTELNALVQSITDAETERMARAERSLLRLLGGSCQVPVAGYAVPLDDGRIRLRGFVANPDTLAAARAEAVGWEPDTVAQAVAEQLLAQGGVGWIQRSAGPTEGL
ncbi:MAG: hydroxymethylbilane synthase [Alicyclobacillus sp.]|nr:hydroxymethylbilane synthase [Alicyclobacillus sp.]